MDSSTVVASPSGANLTAWPTAVYFAKHGLQGKDLTLSEAKSILRDIMTLCERQPNRKKLAEARAKAKVHMSMSLSRLGDSNAAICKVCNSFGRHLSPRVQPVISLITHASSLKPGKPSGGDALRRSHGGRSCRRSTRKALREQAIDTRQSSLNTRGSPAPRKT